MVNFIRYLLVLVIGYFSLELCASSDVGIIPVVDNVVACGGNQPSVITQSFGFLLSPRFDNFNYYPQNSECTWTFQAPKGKVIVFRKLEFALDMNCDMAALEIHEEGDVVRQYCGYYMPTIYKSRTNTVHLRFYGSKHPRTVGFQFYFEHSPPTVRCKEDEITCRHMTKCVSSHVACDGVDDCSDGTDEENCEPHEDAMGECGIPKIKPALGNDRIVGGRDAIPGSWPWQVSLRIIDRTPFSHWCGGVLINRKWVVTAAHCFKNGLLDTALWNVLLGKHFRLIPDVSEQLRYVKSIHINPDYKGMEARLSEPWLIRKSHDIALVELNSPVNVTDSIIPICLPPNGKDLAEGTLCYVTGWGDTYNTGFELVLKQAAVPVVSRATCDKWYRFHPIADTMICAGYQEGGHDACQGDSGGPLVYQDDGKIWKLAGIVSTGGLCADEEQPGIYTAVPSYIDWIEKTMKTSINNSSM